MALANLYQAYCGCLNAAGRPVQAATAEEFERAGGPVWLLGVLRHHAMHDRAAAHGTAALSCAYRQQPAGRAPSPIDTKLADEVLSVGTALLRLHPHSDAVAANVALLGALSVRCARCSVSLDVGRTPHTRLHPRPGPRQSWVGWRGRRFAQRCRRIVGRW